MSVTIVNSIKTFFAKIYIKRKFEGEVANYEIH